MAISELNVDCCAADRSDISMACPFPLFIAARSFTAYFRTNAVEVQMKVFTISNIIVEH